MSRLLIFTLSKSQSKYEVGRVVEEAKKMGVEVVRGLYCDLGFKLGEESKVFVKGKEVGDFEGVWFRVAGTDSGKYIKARNLLIRLWKDKVFCVNGRGYLNWPRMGKIDQHGVFVKEKIPIVETSIFYTKQAVLDYKFEYPVVAKNEMGFQGKTVVKVENREEMEKLVEKISEARLGLWMWQKCLSTRWDIRVIVIGGRVVGGMKRTANGDEFRSNYSLGGQVEEYKLSEEESKLAERVANVCGLDYCGVDIMKDREGNNFVLEVNRACQFKGFEEATGINVAREVVNLLV